MRPCAWVFLVLLLAGCVQTDCLNCDDGNPCTSDSCSEGKCSHAPLSGPVVGCFSAGGCIEYGCFGGECLPQKKVQCCGNGICNEGENYTTCARDCKPTCFDGIKNQGEDQMDCGGPCSPCVWSDVNYIRKVGYLRGVWYESASNYTDAIKSYNAVKADDRLMIYAMESYGEVDNLQGMLAKDPPPEKYAHLMGVFNDTLSLHMEAIHLMILFLKLHDDGYRLDSNRLFSDALVQDHEFVREYNTEVDGVNKLQARCSNLVQDGGEESVDCGGICRVPCDATINVTKYITIRSEGTPAHIVMNVSSPAIDYSPMQRLISYRVRPIPDYRELSVEGNLYNVYEFNIPSFGVREFEITQTVRLRRLPAPVVSASGYFSPIYLIDNNNSQMTPGICFRAVSLLSPSKNVSETASNIYEWMSGNIRYEANRDELGAEYCYLNKRGACDEQADLFVSMARCDGLPSRRVTGSLLNESQITGHAWAEYYDGGSWIYLDPSVKDRMQAFTADNRHLTSCVGEGAYHCGVEYSYTYTGKKPKIEVAEQVYLS